MRETDWRAFCKLADPYVLIGIGLVLFAVGVCGWGAATHGLEYDELWTLRHYAVKQSAIEVFQDLKMPNNHPLHSLLVRLSVRAAGSLELRMRIWPLLAFGGLLVVLPFFFQKFVPSATVTFLALAWCASSAPLLHFGETSRGYALQTLLVVAFSLMIGAANRGARHERVWLTGAVIAGTAAVLTLPTSVLFLVPVAGCDLGNRIWRRRHPGEANASWVPTGLNRCLLAYIILGLLAGSWLYYGAPQWSQGRANYGQPMRGAGEMFLFARGAWVELFGPPMIALMACALLPGRRRRLSLCIAMLLGFPFLVAPLTHGGPARVYLPLVPFGLWLAALGFARLLEYLETWFSSRTRTAVVIVAALVPLAQLPRGLAQWSPPDWRKVLPLLHQELPADWFVGYPSVAGYVIRHYYSPLIQQDVASRVPAGSHFVLAQIDLPGQIGGVDPINAATVSVPIPREYRARRVSVAGLDVDVYRGRRVTADEPSRSPFLLAAIGPDDRQKVRATVAEFCQAHGPGFWVVLNGLLSEALAPTETAPPSTACLLLAREPRLSASEMRQWSERSQGKIRFYALETGT